MIDWWDRCAHLETTPSMAALAYPAHITFAVYDALGEAELVAGWRAAADGLKPTTVEFASLGYFVAPHAVIVWARPDLPATLQAAHARVHETIDVTLCRHNYRPGAWVPHCSLATTIDLARKDEAIELADQPIEPFAVLFDVVDCASFAPVKVLRETRLDA